MFKRTRSLSNASLRSRPIIIKFMYNLRAVKLNKAIIAKNPTQNQTRSISDDVLLSYGHLKFFTLWPENGHRITDTVCDFIICPMLLCSALDRQQETNVLPLHHEASDIIESAAISRYRYSPIPPFYLLYNGASLAAAEGDMENWELDCGN